METDRWNRIQQLYHTALELPPSVRAEFLSQSSTNDPELVREVESLLSFAKQADELLENPEWKSDTLSETGRSGTRVAIGSQIGSFRIVEFLGAGGMGEVYRAIDTRLHRDVAIKILPAEYAQQPEWFARFQREAVALASLNHPHICVLHDVGPNCLVMEYIEGEPLAGPLPLAKAVEFAGQILDALDAAHRKGITHRDLKPTNVLVTHQGIKLLDFGMAKQAGGLAESRETLTPAMTQKGQILGTLQYMSPEQLQGKEADGRSDLFSFGCVLYEMVMGKRAFEGTSAASVIAAILEREPPSLKETASAALDQIVRRCMAKDPEQRWQAARDLRAALDLVLAPQQDVQAARGTPTRLKLV